MGKLSFLTHKHILTKDMRVEMALFCTSCVGLSYRYTIMIHLNAYQMRFILLTKMYNNFNLVNLTCCAILLCFLLFCVFVFYVQFSHGAHKLDISTLFTTLFL